MCMAIFHIKYHTHYCIRFRNYFNNVIELPVKEYQIVFNLLFINETKLKKWQQ